MGCVVCRVCRVREWGVEGGGVGCGGVRCNIYNTCFNERREGRKKEVSKVKQTTSAIYTIHVLMRDEKEGRKK